MTDPGRVHDDPPPVVARLSEFVDWYATRTPNAEAAVCGDVRVTYAELRQRVDATARALLRAGVQRGDRVATLSPPNIDFWVTFLATVSIGGIWLGLNPRYRVDELSYVVGDAEPIVLFARTQVGTRRYDDEIEAMRRAAPAIARVVALDAPRGGGAAGEHHVSDAPHAYESMDAFVASGAGLPDETLAAARRAGEGREACLLVYTSGSTGRPKGALLHHAGIVAFSLAQNRIWPLRRQRFLNYLPINHVGCVIDLSVPTLAAGGCLVFLEQFSPDGALALTVQERVNCLGSVPTVFQMQLALPDFDAYDLSGIELIIWEGAAMPIEVIERLRAICPRLATNYGMTETTSAITIVEPTDDLDVLANTVGRAFPGVEIRLVGEDGHVVAPGQPGEVQARSLYNLLGYWRRPEATAAAFTSDGFFRTGDVAVQRADGRYRLVGRLKEMYKSGGYNVYPREVEDVIHSHPDVIMAAVVPRPDPLWDEVGVAFVVARPTLTADALADHCRARLANYKLPKAFVLCPDLPLLPIGKIDKVALTRRAAEL
ncbi:MAG TPA: AMP-binding protein [Gemmatimonadaceae bacterium]|nr:AMP-binding protein [Gemmatimonadaceae bacterium]